MFHIWVEKKFVSVLGQSKLNKFKVVNGQRYQATFRCPYCGDSKKDPNKTRANVYESEGKLFFKCFNCGHSTTASKLIKDVDPELYKEYRLECMKEGSGSWEPRIEDNPIRRREKFDALKSDLVQKVSSLPVGHSGREYVESRKIPPEQHHRLWWTPCFAKWINTFIPDKLNESNDGPRLVLPMVDSSGYVFGVQGRSLDGKEPRYYTIMFDEDRPKVFGMDEVDVHQRVYVVEGPIDSLFIPNAVAMAGISPNLKVAEDFVVVLDNQPRNPEVIKLFDKYVSQGTKVCIWPSHIEEKDINDMILAGMSSREVKNIIDEGTCQGAEARLKFNFWKKI